MKGSAFTGENRGDGEMFSEGTGLGDAAARKFVLALAVLTLAIHAVGMAWEIWRVN